MIIPGVVAAFRNAVAYGNDPYSSEVVFLLDGSNISDSSSSATEITNSGITIVDGAYQCNGSGQLDTTTNASNFDMFAVDSTIELFMERSASAYGAIFGQSGGYNIFGMSVAGPLKLHVATSEVFSIPVPSPDVNHHIEITHRISDRQIKIYVDGVLSGTGTATGTPPGGSNVTWFGEQPSGSPPQLGYGGLVKISGVRITRNVIRHTGDFTPPTPPF